MNAFDEMWMQQALEQAQMAVGLSSPNPRVGCVLVQNQQCVGAGYTQALGLAHAEVMAIRSATLDLQGCTVYVTLEPCAHYGRTPPCVDALKAIAPKRVVVACLDANPQVAGQGVAALRLAGITVDVLDVEHPLAQKAWDLNIGFMQRMQQQRIYTRLKWASSIDGKTALPDGKSQWITGAGAREDGQLFRARADVIVTGVGTVLHDNPQLNVRVKTLANPAIKCVLDTHLRTPIDARLFDDKAPVLLVCAAMPDEPAMQQRLLAAHEQLKIITMPLRDGRIDLSALWAWFAQQQINEAHIEAGATLNAALLKAGLVDELLIYMAPRIIGSGLSSAQFSGIDVLDDLSSSAAWRWLDVCHVGEDLRLRAQIKRS